MPYNRDPNLDFGDECPAKKILIKFNVDTHKKLFAQRILASMEAGAYFVPFRLVKV